MSDNQWSYLYRIARGNDADGPGTIHVTDDPNKVVIIWRYTGKQSELTWWRGAWRFPAELEAAKHRAEGPKP